MSYDPTYINCRIYAARGYDVYVTRNPRVQVRFELSPDARAAGAQQHAKDVAWHNAAARTHRREGGGNLGAGALGNRMLYGWHATQDAACQKAFEQLRGIIEGMGGQIGAVQGGYTSIRMPDGGSVERLTSILEQHEPLFVIL